MALYPVFPSPTAPDPESQLICRLPPAGGCISFIRYARWTSVRMKEYGPYNRFVDRAKLIADLTYDDIVINDRYAVAVKVALLGVAENQRYLFQDLIFPFKGLNCPA